MTLPNFKYFYNNKSNTLDIILPGGSYGMDSSFIEKVIASCKNAGHCVLTFNFPYFDRGEENASGPELKEELLVLDEMMKFVNANSFEHIRFVAKSLGAIVASYFLKNVIKEEHLKYSIVVLGYVTGRIDLKGFLGKISIIQGEKDRFGGIDVVRKEMESALSDNISFFQIDGADHSFRRPETKEPIYEDRAIEIFSSLAN